MNTNNVSTKPRPQSVKKFYFLEYFYVLLKSVQSSSHTERIFEQFLELKQKYRLGESRYKRRVLEAEGSPNRMVRYRYTFEQVVMEAKDYGFVVSDNGSISLTDSGQKIISTYEDDGAVECYQTLFKYMEDKYQAFRYLIETCYANNPEKSGLLIFPIYSAYRLGINRDSIKTSSDLNNYFDTLQKRLEDDIQKYLNQQCSLSDKNKELVSSLIDSEIIPNDPSQPFNPTKYNVIMKRVRDFWLKYFLQDLYNFSISLNAFEIWAYRGKQAGVFHITEFYPDPNFSGRLVYPLCVVRGSTNSEQFDNLFKYSDGKNLYLHQPSWDNEETQEEFLQQLHYAYLDIRNQVRSYFVNLLSVRERVCYTMRIPEYLFDQFLGYAYRLRSKIRISLEVDKLPEETKVMYVRREPVVVDGKSRNIIAVDLN